MLRMKKATESLYIRQKENSVQRLLGARRGASSPREVRMRAPWHTSPPSINTSSPQWPGPVARGTTNWKLSQLYKL